MFLPLTQEHTHTGFDVDTELRSRILRALERDHVVILPPMDVFDSIRLVERAQLSLTCAMLDPWYNKGVGGVRDDYYEFISRILDELGRLAGHIYLWGFPEIVARFVTEIPATHELTAWLTWYYKNNPSVIRGWRSSQMACLHLSKPGAPLYPEHFLNEAQKEKQAQGKLRYMPGPTSVIEAPLLVGFVGRSEQTGHPAQKPVSVYDRLLRMVTKPGDLVFDPMSGSGTTGVVAKMQKLRAILCDHSEEYTQLMERRLGLTRLSLPPELGCGQADSSKPLK